MTNPFLLNSEIVNQADPKYCEYGVVWLQVYWQPVNPSAVSQVNCQLYSCLDPSTCEQVDRCSPPEQQQGYCPWKLPSDWQQGWIPRL